MKRIMLCAVALFVPIAAFSASFAGKWLIQTENSFTGRVQTLLELSQVGDKVAGTMSVIAAPSELSLPVPVPLRIYGGKIESNTVTFYVWTRGDEPLKDIYKGVLTEKGEIRFEVERGVGPPRAVPPLADGGADTPPPPAGSQVTAVPVL